MSQSMRDKITVLVGYDKAEEIFQLVEEAATTRCRDVDCFRWWPHSNLSRHFWRHEPKAPLTRDLFGWMCFTCHRYTWQRIHRKKA